MSTFRFTTLATLLFAAAPAFAQPSDTPPPTPTPPETTVPPTPPTPPAPPPTPPTPPPPENVAPPEPPVTPPTPPAAHPTYTVASKWEASLYGFVEFDMIKDTTQGLIDLAANSAIARPSTYAGDHGQVMIGARNSRIGFKLGAPTYDGIKATAQLEMDFLGNQPGKPFDASGLVSESAFWQNPGFRIRHMNVKLEMPMDTYLLAGQYWQLFGWQSAFHPSSVAIQGLPGQVYSRAPQLRAGKIFKSDAVNVDVAVAALRPPDRASSTPDGQAGVKLSINHWKAWHTGGSAGSGLDAAAIGVSVDGRRFAADTFSSAPNKQVTRNGYGISLDALIPVVAATKESKANALTLTASFVTGAGIADQYTSLNGGVSNPALPNPTMATPAPTYTPNIDSGLAMFYANGDGTYSLHPIQWTSEIVGLQYYLPPSGRLFLSVNYSHLSSGNVDDFGPHNKTFNASQFADLNVFFDLTPAVRFGLEGSYLDQTYTDGTDAPDYRAQFSAFFIF